MASSLTSSQLIAANVSANNIYSGYYHLGDYTIGNYSKFEFGDIESVTTPYTPDDTPNEGDIWVFKVSGSSGYFVTPYGAAYDHLFVWMVNQNAIPAWAQGICFFRPDKVVYWSSSGYAMGGAEYGNCPSGFYIQPTLSGQKMLGPYSDTFYVLMYRLYDD